MTTHAHQTHATPDLDTTPPTCTICGIVVPLHRGQHVTVHALEWFDRTNGNSYCAVRVYVDGVEVNGRVEFGYGYGDAYQQYALELLADLGYVESGRHDNGIMRASWREVRDEMGVAVHPSITRGLKREVVEYGRQA